jgi:hypothetical protein
MCYNINNILNNDSLVVTLSHLKPLDDLPRSCCVCKKWKDIGISLWGRLDLEALFPTLHMIDGQAWKDHLRLEELGLEIDDPEFEMDYLSPTDKRTLILTLKKLFASPLIDNEAGMTLMTLPERLTIHTFLRLQNSPHLLRKGNLPRFAESISPRVLEVLGDVPVGKTCRIVIANTALKVGSNQFFTYTQQEELLAQLPGCERTSALAVIALNMMTYIISDEESPTRLFGDRLYFYARCSEQIDNADVLIGGFTSRGLEVHNEACNEGFSVVPMQKF